LLQAGLIAGIVLKQNTPGGYQTGRARQYRRARAARRGKKTRLVRRTLRGVARLSL
jgi:hypothetical protein